jgi:hypothetical protein
MKTIIYHRPDEYQSEYADCSVVALSVATGISYDSAHDFMERFLDRENRGTVSTKRLNDVLTELPMLKPIFEDRTVYDFVNTIGKTGRYLCHIPGHIFAVKDGSIFDVRANCDENFQDVTITASYLNVYLDSIWKVEGIE